MTECGFLLMIDGISSKCKPEVDHKFSAQYLAMTPSMPPDCDTRTISVHAKMWVWTPIDQALKGGYSDFATRSKS